MKDDTLISERLPEPDREENYTLKVDFGSYFGLLIAKYLIHEDSPNGEAEWFTFTGQSYTLLSEGTPVAWKKS